MAVGHQRRNLSIALVLVICGAMGWWVLKPTNSAHVRDKGGALPPSSVRPQVALATAASPTAPPPRRPAGERLIAGARPVQGQIFAATARDGTKVSGTLFRAAARRAPLLVFMGEAGQGVAAWTQTLETLRASRDYHLVVTTAPQTQAEQVARVELTTGVGSLETALLWTQRELGSAIVGVALVGGGLGGSAAALLMAERRDITALVAISAAARLGNFTLPESPDSFGGRHTRWVASEGDERGAGALEKAQTLVQAVVHRRPGHMRGAELLAHDRRARTSMAGWLFSVMPEPQR
ncbi:MAG: hypothetical protein KC502_11570 [Myxococcales bacterium]|nr:hypothetical protein [Myxococcales bacterium]